VSIQILKRLAVWVGEISLEASVIGLLLIGLLGYDRNAFGRGWLTYTAATAYMFFATGYLITTVISRVAWRGRSLWPYSVVATALFLIHFEVLNVGVEGAFDIRSRLRIRLVGACIAFAFTLAGSLVLRKWVPPHTKLVESLRT